MAGLPQKMHLFRSLMSSVVFASGQADMCNEQTTRNFVKCLRYA